MKNKLGSVNLIPAGAIRTKDRGGRNKSEVESWFAIFVYTDIIKKVSFYSDLWACQRK